MRKSSFYSSSWRHWSFYAALISFLIPLHRYLYVPHSLTHYLVSRAPMTFPHAVRLMLDVFLMSRHHVLGNRSHLPSLLLPFKTIIVSCIQWKNPLFVLEQGARFIPFMDVVRILMIMSEVYSWYNPNLETFAKYLVFQELEFLST